MSCCSTLPNWLGVALRIRDRQVYIYRGKKDKANKYWDIQENEVSKSINYQISSENDLLLDILKNIDKDFRTKLIRYLGDLAENLPINHIYQKMSESPRDISQDEVGDALLDSIMKRILNENADR